MAAMDLVEAELPNFPSADSHQQQQEGKRGHKEYRNPLLLGLTPYLYLLRALRSIKAPDLEQALLVLPFHYVTRLISMLIKV